MLSGRPEGFSQIPIGRYPRMKSKNALARIPRKPFGSNTRLSTRRVFKARVNIEPSFSWSRFSSYEFRKTLRVCPSRNPSFRVSQVRKVKTRSYRWPFVTTLT